MTQAIFIIFQDSTVALDASQLRLYLFLSDFALADGQNLPLLTLH